MDNTEHPQDGGVPHTCKFLDYFPYFSHLHFLIWHNFVFSVLLVWNMYDSRHSKGDDNINS